MSMVVCKLPKAGLGNQLFPLTKALLFAHLNKLPLVVINYNQVKIGPYLRREKNKRNYKGFFKFQKSFFAEQIDKWRLSRCKHYQQVHEPCPGLLKEKTTGNALYCFTEMPHWNDYFKGIKENRGLAIQLLMEQVSDSLFAALRKQPVPVIGVHIRMGDFRKLQPGEDFATVGAVRTPGNYFTGIIKGIREINGSNLPVTIFTDGYKNELQGIFELGNVSISEGNPDLLDLLLLSRSKIIVTSAGSTFSYWAGFLSDAALIMHPDHLHEPIRPVELNRVMYEGVFDAGNVLLSESIKKIA